MIVVTVILRNLTDEFYAALAALPTNASRYDHLRALARDLSHCISFKEGNGSFRDRVELNLRKRVVSEPAYRLEPRRGYRLARFEF